MLISAIEDVKAGRLETAKAIAMAKLAAQVNESMKVELAALDLVKKLGLKGFLPKAIGSLPAGEEINPS